MAIIKRPFKEYIDGTKNTFGDTNDSYYGEDTYTFLEEIQASQGVVDSIGCVVYEGDEPLIIIGVEDNHQWSDYYYICLDLNKEIVRKDLLLGDDTCILSEDEYKATHKSVVQVESKNKDFIK